MSSNSRPILLQPPPSSRFDPDTHQPQRVDSGSLSGLKNADRLKVRQNPEDLEIFQAEVDEKTRNFILEQNAEMRKFLSGEMEKLFAGLSKSFDEKVAAVAAEVEHSIQKLSASLNRKLSSVDSKMEMSTRNLSEEFRRKLSTTQSNVEVSLAGLSETFGGELRRSESEVSSELVSLNETLLRNHRLLSLSLVNLKASLNSTPLANESTDVWNVGGRSNVISSQPPVQTEVEEVNLNEGTIEFVGGANLHLRRKIWVLRSEGQSLRREMRFQLEENGLREEARLSLWSSGYPDGGQHVWNGTQPNWWVEKMSLGPVILVTLLIPRGGAERPSFKLKFNTTYTHRDYPYSSEVVLGEGRQVVSFPPNNTHNYPRGSEFVAVVAPPSGSPFGLTLTFLDLPCNDNFFGVYFLEETPTGKPYKRLPPSAFTECGSVDGISEPLGNFTVAIIRFYASAGRVGRGFRLEVN